MCEVSQQNKHYVPYWNLGQVDPAKSRDAASILNNLTFPPAFGYSPNMETWYVENHLGQ